MRILLSQSAPRRSRQGLSILEVLVASFILLFGLMGVAAMFPVGQLYVAEATRHDTASSVGQAAFNDIQVRGLLNPEMWIGVDTTADTHLIDPLAGVGDFPHGGGALKRVTYNGMTAPLAQNIFQSRDDLVVELPDDPDLPAFQPTLGGPTRAFNGQYSWMFMAQQMQGSGEQFRVSVIVYHKRVLDTALAMETDLGNSPIVGGLGGGTVELSGTAEQLEVAKPGQWMLLYSKAVTPRLFKWYRIVAADEYDTATSKRWVTLQGPDWPTGVTPRAVVLDGVVAVYEKVMQRAKP